MCPITVFHTGESTALPPQLMREALRPQQPKRFALYWCTTPDGEFTEGKDVTFDFLAKGTVGIHIHRHQAQLGRAIAGRDRAP